MVNNQSGNAAFRIELDDVSMVSGVVIKTKIVCHISPIVLPPIRMQNGKCSTAMQLHITAATVYVVKVTTLPSN